MSRIAELIAKLCPNGIEYVKLGDVCTITKGKTPIQKAIPGEYPLVVTTSERKSCNTYQFDKSAVCIPLVSSRGHGVASLNHVYFQSGKFALGNILCAVIPNDENVLSANFLFHYLEYKKDTLLVPLMKGGANVSLHIYDIQRVKIPLPPLDVQLETIEILDKFVELSEMLTKELSIRKKQYEYYRDFLLDFDVHEGGTNECEWRTIKEIFDIRNGYTPSKSNVEYWENGIIPWFRMDDIRENGRILSNSIQHIARKGVKKSGIFPANSLIMSTTATIGEHALIKTNFVCNQQITCFSLKQEYSSKINIKFVFYLFFNFGEWCRNNVNNGGGLPIINTAKLSTYKIPIPTIEKQKRIVSILDRFDKLCNDISEGLPAEIEARRKQYEYYRDKLLSFKEQ